MLNAQHGTVWLLPALHFWRDGSALLFCRKYCSIFSQAWDRIEFLPVQAIFSTSPSP